MKKYEGLIILPQPVDEQTLEDKLDKIRAEITKHGGVVEHTTRMGRQTFARRLKKKDTGFYILLTFTIDPLKIAALRERYKLNEDVFRVQFTLAPPPAREGAKEADKDAKKADKPIQADGKKPAKI
ncbi:MAG: 30S ribosomal protein S6 [Kiritimatiellae bacterium]|nr:30S ribosomal protein S6 [Kiritimatiellia bacterium]